ncbi:MAG: ribosome recycling factor [Verrucomicrobiales bacterium]|nr:ribosome recycling factor [Verrucomicrobiales bacterium]
MDTETFLLETDEAMQKATDFVSQEMSSIRTGKASPALLDNINVNVEAYGTSMPLKQLALVSAPEPRLLTVQPHDPSIMGDVERALRESKLGITPASDGRLIRLPIPELSEERRKDLVKIIKDMAEQGRVRVRSARKDAMDQLKNALKDSSITEDSFHDMEKEVQELTDKNVKAIDEHLAAKEKDVMTV